MIPSRTLLVVTGPSGAGKTTLARALGTELAVPVFHKDDLKETLFDVLPDRSLDERARFGIASFVLLERIVRAVLPYGSALIEANFDGRIASEGWRRIVAETDVEARVIVLHAPLDVLTARILHRASSGERHPGHTARAAEADAVTLPPLDLGVPILHLDATSPPEALLHEALIWLRTSPSGA